MPNKSSSKRRSRSKGRSKSRSRSRSRSILEESEPVFSVQDCMIFRRMDTNPVTQKRMKPNGSTAKGLSKQCIEHFHPTFIGLKRPTTAFDKIFKNANAVDICNAYIDDPSRSPFSGRRKYTTRSRSADKLSRACWELTSPRDLKDYRSLFGKNSVNKKMDWSRLPPYLHRTIAKATHSHWMPHFDYMDPSIFLK